MSISARLLALGALLVGAACGDARPRVVLATTTSTYDSGLLPLLIADFEQSHPDLRVSILVVGTGEALALGRAGDVDVTLTHHPPAESMFVAAGFAVQRHPVMRNDFVIAGPADDPAGLAGTDALRAFREIDAAEHPFISRDDDSGTHRRELELWAQLGVEPPRGRGWYVRSGSGMADALRLAAQRRAYLLTDEATFEMIGVPLGLRAHVTGDARLANPYAAMQVLRARNPEGAAMLIAWLTGTEGQQRIARFGVERTGRSLFRPEH